MNGEEEKILNEQNLNNIKNNNVKKSCDNKEDIKKDECKTNDKHQYNTEKIEKETLDKINKRDLRITQLEIELKKIQFELRDSKLRSQAEIENIQRRNEIDLEKVHKFSLEKFINELLPVIDNLERALKIVDIDKNIKNSQITSILEGINLTLKSLLNTVKKFGIEVVSEVNVPFNPDIHQAMTLIDSEEVAPNHVIMVMQSGYTLNGRLLRPAMVTVSKPKNK